MAKEPGGERQSQEKLKERLSELNKQREEIRIKEFDPMMQEAMGDKDPEEVIKEIFASNLDVLKMAPDLSDEEKQKLVLDATWGLFGRFGAPGKIRGLV